MTVNYLQIKNLNWDLNSSINSSNLIEYLGPKSPNNRRIIRRISSHSRPKLGPNLGMILQECVRNHDLHQKDKILKLQWKIPL